jgi:hypothetical protein
MSQAASDPAHAFRRHFDEGELQRIDLLMEKFGLLLERGLTTRKLEKWASVVHFRMTQLSTVDGFGFSQREVNKIKGAYLHAHGKAEREADQILSRHAITVRPAAASTAEPHGEPGHHARLSAALLESKGEEAYVDAALALLEPGQRPTIPEWAADLMDSLFPLMIPDQAGERWGLALVEQAITAFSLVAGEEWTTLDHDRVQAYLDAGLPIMCEGEHGAGPPPTLSNDNACARCAAGMLDRHEAARPLRDLFVYLREQPGWQRLMNTGLLGSGTVAQLAAAGRVLEGQERELFETASATAEGLGSAPAFVVVLRDLGFTAPASR